jgi:hypothetical protein
MLLREALLDPLLTKYKVQGDITLCRRTYLHNGAAKDWPQKAPTRGHPCSKLACTFVSAVHGSRYPLASFAKNAMFVEHCTHDRALLGPQNAGGDC